MSDRPILFSAPMVRALLDGRKTQTRRLIKWQGPKGYPHSFEHAKVDNPAGVPRLLVPYNHPDEADEPWGENGYFRHYSKADPGDRLYVREHWRTEVAFDGFAPGDLNVTAPIRYEADGTRVRWRDDWQATDLAGRFRQSMHMPRWASRLTLHVTDVRVQRLQDISEEDAVAEGVYCGKASGRFADDYAAMSLAGEWFATARSWYRDLWGRINGSGSWANNPWVFAYTFDVERGNIGGGA